MIKYTKNRYVDAFLKMLLFLAIIHFLTICTHFAIVRNISSFNLFHLLGLDMIFPNIGIGETSNTISSLLFISLYTIILLLISKKTKKD